MKHKIRTHVNNVRIYTTTTVPDRNRPGLNPVCRLFGAWSFLLVHIRFTHDEGPKRLYKPIPQEIRPQKLNHEVRP